MRRTRLLLDELRAVAPRGRGERARQIARGDEPVRLDQQSAERAVAELRLFGARGLRVEQQRRHAAPRQHIRGRPQRAQLLVGRSRRRACRCAGTARRRRSPPSRAR